MAVTINARGTSVSSFQIGKGGPTLTATAGVLELRDGQTFKILDSGNTDSIAFSHDGTDFNIAGTNTTDINLTGITALQAANNVAVAQEDRFAQLRRMS